MHVKRHISTAVLAVVLTAGSAAAANAAPVDVTAPATTPTSSVSLAGVDHVPAGVTITPQIRAYLETLPADQRADFINTKLPATSSEALTSQTPMDATARLSASVAQLTGQKISPMTTGCWAGRADGSERAALGNTLFTYYHVGEWCVSGSTVTSSSVADAGGETSTPGWRYDGVINRSAGILSNEGRSYSQTRFILGSGGWDVQTIVPCLRVRGLSNATFYSDATCGIY